MEKIKNVVMRKATHEKRNRESLKTKVYFHIEDESVVENVMNRHNRDYTKYRKLLPEVFKQLNITENIKANWSQYAGCKCPCSPGFVLQNHWGYDIFVTIGIEE